MVNITSSFFVRDALSRVEGFVGPRGCWNNCPLVYTVVIVPICVGVTKSTKET